MAFTALITAVSSMCNHDAYDECAALRTGLLPVYICDVMGAENPTVVAKPEILLLDVDALAGNDLPLLRAHYEVRLGHSVAAAAEYLQRSTLTCDFLISDIRAYGEETFQLFRTAKSVVVPPTILVTTADAAAVPDALIAGGDAILLKPYSPNLLFSRLGRLKRERDAQKRGPGVPSFRGLHSSAARTADSLSVHCPHCNAARAVAFDFLSHRRAWFACLACKKVWIATKSDA